MTITWNCFKSIVRGLGVKSLQRCCNCPSNNHYTSKRSCARVTQEKKPDHPETWKGTAEITLQLYDYDEGVLCL